MKNCVVFNDLSGYGNCSLMAAIPVLTVMGVRVHPVLRRCLPAKPAMTVTPWRI